MRGEEKVWRVLVVSVAGVGGAGGAAELAVWRAESGRVAGSSPRFLTVSQLVEVEAGGRAELECAVADFPAGRLHHLTGKTLTLSSCHNLRIAVSWLRWGDLSVLTAGALVFSSDPRLAVTQQVFTQPRV